MPEEVVLTLSTIATTPITAAQIAQWTGRDPVLAKVREYVRQGWPSEGDVALRPYTDRRLELSVVDGCLLWGSRVVIPPQAQGVILKELHEGDPGICRMRALSRSYVWWPGLDAAIEQQVRACPTCQQHRKPPPEAPLHP